METIFVICMLFGLTNGAMENGFTECCHFCEPGETFSQYLWRQSADLQHAALNTTLIQGLKTGTLNPASFGGFNIMDAVWCEKTSESIKIAADRVSFDRGVHLRAYLLQESQSYKAYADRLYKDWSVANPSGVFMNGGAIAYWEYERMVAQRMDIAYFLTCMIPCVKLWPWLGSQLITGNDAFGAYSDWIHYNFDPSYDSYKVLDQFVDDMCENGELDEVKAMNVFRNCLEGEVDSFRYSA